MTRCPKCGTQNNPKARFCGSCGGPLQAAGGHGMSALKVILGFLVLLVVGVLVIGGCAYKGYRQTIHLDESVQSAWADVEVVLKRRFDLIPNVVETVKGYAKHEKDLFQGIADVRKSYFSANTMAEKAKAASTLDGMLSRLLVLRETYPELKANDNFRMLQVELEGTENRIAEKRKVYNGRVRELNAYIRAFPGSMYAGWAGVQKGEYFEAEEEAKEAPQVSFG